MIPLSNVWDPDTDIDPDTDPDPVGSRLFCRIRIRTFLLDPDILTESGSRIRIRHPKGAY
jgi:hypothetical protein